MIRPYHMISQKPKQKMQIFGKKNNNVHKARGDNERNKGKTKKKRKLI